MMDFSKPQRRPGGGGAAGRSGSSALEYSASSGGVEAEAIGRALKGQRNGRGWLCRCPAHNDRSPSLSVGTGRDGRLLLSCFAGCTFDDVRSALMGLGILEAGSRDDRPSLPSGPDPIAEADRQRKIDLARWIFETTSPITGFPAEHYLLAHRGITITRDPAADPAIFTALRYHPNCTYRGGGRPALVAGVTNPAGEVNGIWRIVLDDFGNRLERMGLGECRTGAVRLATAADTDHIAVAEGVEDALAFMQLTGLPTWAALSTTILAGMVLPPRFGRVTIAADADKAGADAAKKLASRLKAEGRAVRILYPPAGFKDANAALQGGYRHAGL